MIKSSDVLRAARIYTVELYLMTPCTLVSFVSCSLVGHCTKNWHIT